MKTEPLNQTSLYVSDLEAAERFYENVIGLEVTSRILGSRSTLRHDDFTLVVFQKAIAERGGVSPGRGLGQVSIGICPSEVAPWRDRLSRYGVPIESQMSWPDGTESITCRDPDGNRIQLKTQAHHAHEASEQRGSQVLSNGLIAQWKLFQAATLGVRQTQLDR